MRRARNNGEGSVVVTGPGQEGKRFPNMGAALAYAMHMAGNCRGVDCTWYVRSDSGENLAVESDADGNVTYMTLTGGAR